MKFLGTGKLGTAPRKFESGLKTVLGLKLGTGATIRLAGVFDTAGGRDRSSWGGWTD